MIKIAISSPRFYEAMVKHFPAFAIFFILRLDSFSKLQQQSAIDTLLKFTFVTDGPSKQTSRSRLKLLDIFTFDYIDPNRYHRIHDIGVSSGVTSLEFHNFLNHKKIQHRFLISDKFSTIYISPGLVTRVHDRNDDLMLGYVSPFLASDKNLFFPLSKCLFQLIKRRRISLPRPILRVKLFTPNVREAIRKGEITELDYDIFQRTTSGDF